MQHGSASENNPQARAPTGPGQWAIPYPYGAASATDAMSTIAAPLLAGFSVTLSGVILQASSQFALPSVALLLLALSTALLLFCVQCGFWARNYFVLPTEAREWYDDYGSPDRRSSVQQTQARLYSVYRIWARRARASYSYAIVALLLGFAISLVPLGTSDWQAIPQWAAVCVIALAAVVEFAWLMSARYLRLAPPGVARLLAPAPEEMDEARRSRPESETQGQDNAAG